MFSTEGFTIAYFFFFFFFFFVLLFARSDISVVKIFSSFFPPVEEGRIHGECSDIEEQKQGSVFGAFEEIEKILMGMLYERVAVILMSTHGAAIGFYQGVRLS